MDDARRGQLLVEREKLEGIIRESKTRLRVTGQKFVAFGSALMERAENIAFMKQNNSLRGSSRLFREHYDVELADEVAKAVEDHTALHEAMERLEKLKNELAAC